MVQQDFRETKKKEKKKPRWVQIMAGVFSFYGWIIEAPTIKLTWEGADSLFPPRDGGTGPMLASTCNLKRFGSRWWWKDRMRAFKKKNKKNWRLEITSEEQSRPKIWSHTVKTNVPLTNCFKSSNCPACTKKWPESQQALMLSRQLFQPKFGKCNVKETINA